MENVTPEDIVRVAEKHVKLYEGRIERKTKQLPGHENIQLKSCQGYLAIWKSIVAKGGQELTKLERREVRDAYDSGEFDGLDEVEI